MFGGPPAPKAAPAPLPGPGPAPVAPAPTDKAAQQAEADRRQQNARRRGFAATIATSPMGVSGQSSQSGSQSLGGGQGGGY